MENSDWLSTMPRQYEALFNNAIIGIMLTSQAGEITHVNRFAERQFGYGEGELTGKKVELLIPRNIVGKHEGYRQGFYSQPQTRMMGEGRDLYAVRKDGSEFPAEVSLSHYELAGNSFAIAFIVDITVRKSREWEIRQLNQELEQKVEERTLILQEALLALEISREELKAAYEKEKELGELKSRFVSMASHEFRTPLSTILSSIGLIKRYSNPDELHNQERHIVKIQTAVKNLNFILEDFLSLGKLEEGLVKVNREIIHKPLFVDDVENMLQEMVQASAKKQTINHSHTTLEDYFVLDRKLVRNILVNLVSNAIKYSPENSTIKINCGIVNGSLQIMVSDEGIGISAEDQQHLFERFYRASNTTSIQGTGLGLHIVRRYLDLMDGQVVVESRLNEGTTITVSIPQPKPADT